MVDRVSSGVGSLSAIRDALKATGQFGPAPITPEMETYAQTYRDFLGTPDYASRDKEATDLAKLQMFLAMAQRGFAGAGEAQRPGEHAVSTFFRTVGAPLAQDLSPIAGRLMQQRQATKAAREQEDRAIKLAALTAGTAARDRLTDAAIKLLPKPADISDAPYYVLQEKADGTVDFARREIDEDTFSGRLQVRLRDDGGLQHIRTNRLFELGPRQFISKADDLEDYGLSLKPTDAEDAALQQGEFHLVKPDGTLFSVSEKGKTRTPQYRIIGKGKNRGRLVDLGTDKIFDQKTIKNQGLTLKKIHKPTAAVTGKGLDDPKFKASFRGMLAQFGRLQKAQDLGKRGVKFDPSKFAQNPDLEPGPKFPFNRVDGIPLTEDQQINYAENLRASYLNHFLTIKPGEEPANLGVIFAQAELGKSIADLGLPAAPKGVARTREQITSPPVITEHYKKAPQGFRNNAVAQNTIRTLPRPVGANNLRSGQGRLVLFDDLGVNFGEDTTAPASLGAKPTNVQIDQRATRVKGLDRESIQKRYIAERLAKSTTPLGTKLRPSTADTLDKQLVVVGDALDVEEKKLSDALADPAGMEIGKTISKSLSTVSLLDRLDAKMKLSGIGGFITGPLEVIAKQRFDLDLGAWLRTPEGQEAANEVMATLPILQQLIARDLLKGTGEQRISDQDLRGVQRTLIDINKADGFNADTLKALRRHLVSSVKHSLEYVGSYGLPESTFRQAAQLGIDLKSIKGRNNIYSPYLADDIYPVTKQPVPRFSRAYQKQLRDSSIFGYVAESGGGQPKQYRLFILDAEGQPVFNQNTKKLETVVVPAGEGWQKYVDTDVLQYNRNWLLKTYGLDR